MTTLSITAASLAGMYKFNESNIVNSIEFVKEGEHAGKLKINVSTSILTSKNIIADVSSVQAVFSLKNDDLGEEDIENNLVNVENFLDLTSGKTVENGQFLLPADSWKDVNVLDWVLSIKTNGEDSTEQLFNEYMVENFNLKSIAG